jgi:cytochrome c oxidase assembly protein subunit 15
VARPARWNLGDPAVLQRLNVASLVMVVLIMLTGAAVRLTGSGLGCADWPTCSTGHLTPPLQFHSVVEFSNRMVTVLMVVVVGVTFVVAWLRRPRRTDLLWLSGGLVVGVLAQAVLGGIVVYTKLNPYVVMVHFCASVLLIVDAVVLVHRGRRDYTPGSGHLLVPRPLLLGTRGLLGLFALVIVAGTATSGAGPHAGNGTGQQVAKRIPVALRQMAELHSSFALLTVGLALGLAVALHAIDVPERVRRASRLLVLVLVAQAAVGYTQYFTHLPAVLVEVHVAGATALVVGITQFYLALTHHPAERASGATTTGPLGAAPGGGDGAPGPVGRHEGDTAPVGTAPVANQAPVGG